MQKNTPVLPSRVLDVSKASDGGYIWIHVSCGQRAEYLALSHCWAWGVILTSTTKTLLQRQTCIPLETLSQVFQDAVYATHKLGYRYIWIDSLCILQDSLEDWDAEAAKMADIYQRATLTISAFEIDPDTAGFYQPQVAALIRPCRMPGLDNHLRLREGSAIVPKTYLHPYNPHVSRSYQLDNRAWTLQENVLAPRILGYRTGDVQWSCAEARICECTPNSAVISELSLDTTWRAIMTCFHETFIPVDKPKIQEAYFNWQKVVEEYSRQQLTQETDKLIALSGIAERFQRITNDDYKAGIWLSDLRWSLVWHVPGSHERKLANVKYRPSTYCAPSWSWASTKCKISYPTLLDRFNQLWGHLVAAITHIDVVLSGDNKFGSVNSGLLQVKGNLWPVYAEKNGYESMTNGLFLGRAGGNIPKHYHGTFFPDEPFCGEALCVPIIGYEKGDYTADKICCIVVIPVANDLTKSRYTRIGSAWILGRLLEDYLCEAKFLDIEIS